MDDFINHLSTLVGVSSTTVVVSTAVTVLVASSAVIYMNFSNRGKKPALSKAKSKQLKNKQSSSGNITPTYSQKNDTVQDKSSDTPSSMRGYKQTSDGRKTTYFHRELSAEEKALIGDCTPQRIDVNNPTTNQGPRLLGKSPSITTESKTLGSSSNDTANGSAWNAAGTFEEKDVLSWSQSRLKALLKGITLSVHGADVHDPSVRHIKVTIRPQPTHQITTSLG